MKIAVIGGGIAGLTATYLLGRRHQVELFEAQSWVGGHARTLRVPLDGQDHAVDIGVTLFNDRTYPHFTQLLQQLGVGYRPTELSFSVSDPRRDLEFARRNANSLFARPGNLISPRFWRMLAEALRFRREVNEDLQQQRISDSLTLASYLQLGGYSPAFVDHYILPLGSSVWSMPKGELLDFPLQLFMRVLGDFGLLAHNAHPQWYVVEAGNRCYIEALTQSFRQRIRRHCPVWRVERDQLGVKLFSAAGAERFDKVVFACHSNQALKLLTRPSAAEQSILRALPYVEREVALHTDTRLLPRRRRAWASWNIRLAGRDNQAPAVTYDMSRLQGLNSGRKRLCVSFNQTRAIDPAQLLGRQTFTQPRLGRESLEAQSRWRELLGANHTYYCGAYWGSGFHEDGVVSALRVGEAFGEALTGPISHEACLPQVPRPAVCS